MQPVLVVGRSALLLLLLLVLLLLLQYLQFSHRSSVALVMRHRLSVVIHLRVQWPGKGRWAPCLSSIRSIRQTKGQYSVASVLFQLHVARYDGVFLFARQLQRCLVSLYGAQTIAALLSPLLAPSPRSSPLLEILFTQTRLWCSNVGTTYKYFHVQALVCLTVYVWSRMLEVEERRQEKHIGDRNRTVGWTYIHQENRDITRALTCSSLLHSCRCQQISK